MSKSTIDTSSEFQIYRYRQGICLSRPDRLPSENAMAYMKNIGFTVGEIGSIPANVFFENCRSELQYYNSTCAESLELGSTEKAIGKSVFDYINEADARKTRCNDLEVINSHSQLLFDEGGAKLKDDSYMNFFSLKMPWYDLNGDIIGFFGFGLMLGVHSLAAGLQNILDTRLFMPTLKKNSLHLPMKAGQVYLTQREKEILYYTVRGNTARKISKITNLSFRTIEHYLETIKLKFKVSSKADLIAEVIDNYSMIE